VCAKSTPGSNPGLSVFKIMSENHLVFARKYRPQTFNDVIYQQLTINALQNALRTGRVGHAYLFCGPRGVGKTTIARVLAKRLNCEKPVNNEPCNECISCTEITRGVSNDVIEIDAASNRGIENIRDLRESVKFNPMRGKYRVYIIDEVHMLTEASFNALLKTLEEPPPHVIFILATTEYHKIPETILSRCQDFTFKKVPLANLQSYIEELCKLEKITYDNEGLFWIAKKGDGSVRDTLSFLEQAVTFTGGSLTGVAIQKMLGYHGIDVQLQFLKSVLTDQTSERSIGVIEKLFEEGADLIKFIWDQIEFVHSVLLLKENLASRENIHFPLEDIDKVKKEVANYSVEPLNYISDRMFSIYEKLVYLKLRNSYEIKIFLEIQLRNLILELNKPSVSGLLEKIKDLSALVQKQMQVNPSLGVVPISAATPTVSPETSKTEEVKEKKEVVPPVSSKEIDDVSSVILEQFSGTEIESDSKNIPKI
jgi:DNA polymerase III subunit gamma/tau